MSIPIGIALAFLVSCAAWTDVRSRRIPNGLSVAGVVLGLALNTQAEGITGLFSSVQGLAVAFGVYLLLYLLRAMAAGDVKLMAATGSLIGPAEWLLLLLFVSVAGAVTALTAIAIRGRWRATLRNSAIAAADLVRLRVPAERHPQLNVYSGKGLSLPHAVPIALGTFVFLLSRITL